MKSKVLLPPAVALVAMSIWIGTQRHSITLLETQSDLIRQRIADVRKSRPSDAVAVAGTSEMGQMADSKGRIDWKKIAVRIAEMNDRGGMSDFRERLRLQSQISAMSQEEMLASLDEIATMDIPEKTKDMLDGLLIGPLIEKDPELALKRFVGQIGKENSMMSWNLTMAFGAWAKKDLASSAAWFDQQIAAGSFASKSLDGKNEARLRYEGVMVKSLISSDPDAAGARMAALPEDQRNEVVQQLQNGGSLKEENQMAYAQLVRTQLNENDQNNAFSKMTSDAIVKDGYSAATALLDRISATPEERTAAATQAGIANLQRLGNSQSTVTRDDVDAMRAWVGTQAPDAVDRTTGQALIQATRTGKFDFAEASALVTQYHQTSGNDDVLVSFLSDPNVGNHRDEARVLAEQITDETRRTEVLKKLH